MTLIPLPQNETERLEALHRYEILDTPPEEAFDELTRLAAYTCTTPIAYISLIDADRQWLKAQVGPMPPETPREFAFCSHCILQEGIMLVRDTVADPRFLDNPMVKADPKIRFYAGAPLVNADGLALGSLCVMDYMPRELDPSQIESMRLLSRQVVRQLEIRNNLAALSRAVETFQKSLSE